jgi:hypothetical protein
MRDLFRLTACVVFALGCDRAKQQAAEGPATVEALTQNFTTGNRLITIRYPSSFAADPKSPTTLVLARNLPDGTDEACSFVAVETPVSQDLNEFARVVQSAGERQLHEFAASSRRVTTCNGVAGVEVLGTWTEATTGTVYNRRSCAFLRNGHGYSFSCSVPRQVAAQNEPTLRAIVDATQFQ